MGTAYPQKYNTTNIIYNDIILNKLWYKYHIMCVCVHSRAYVLTTILRNDFYTVVAALHRLQFSTRHNCEQKDYSI